ncbi:MAG TPA: hydrolase [Sulfurospirillum sp. UBA12182]|jgi:phosphoglycolate phosphatase|nr:MAG TPA: hydrolase [Sulfurospirillum sp. UBA12182]
MQKTILFDLDGTLIDSTDAIVEGFKVAYSNFNLIAPKDEEIIKLIGYPLDIMFEKLGVRGDVWDYVGAYKEHYRVISKQKTTLLPFAKEAIEKAATYARLGIVTTKTARYSQELLEHMNIMHHFEILIGRESVENPKPHPEPILKAMSILEANPQFSWMVGDTILDLEAAKKAGIFSVGVLCGYGEKEELQKYSKHIKNNSLEAVEFINSL